MKNAALIVCLFILAASSQVFAGDCVKNQNGDVVCGKGQCATDQHGKVLCAREGGGALRDSYGNVQCGVGNCATDDMGQVSVLRRRAVAPQGIRTER